jgi:uncharacterized membrane protein YkoI
MTIRAISRFATVLGLLAALAAEPAVARDSDSGNGKNHGRGNQQGASQVQRMSAEQASAMVQSRYGGRVVAVKSAGDGYNVRVLLDGGRVKTVNVAANGRMSESN